MAERTRPIRIECCVTEQERELIQNKMAQLGTKNMGAYLRKMAIDGYIIKVDYTQQKKLAAAVSRAAARLGFADGYMVGTSSLHRRAIHRNLPDVSPPVYRQKFPWSTGLSCDTMEKITRNGEVPSCCYAQNRCP